MFCRGSSCKRCGSSAYLSLATPALEKVHSSWINESILAMQRPSELLFAEANLIEQFQRHGICAIFNLTEPGEHPYCGTGVLGATGFPYSPEKLMAHGVRHFNYSWPDMTCPSISVILDIVQVASHQLNDGLKLAVHCHAGYGRTGIVCACILIARFKLNPNEAIQQVRRQRPGSIETSMQVKFVKETFYSAWTALVVVFPPPSAPAEALKSINQSIRNQQQLLSVAELSCRAYRWLPKVFSVCDHILSSQDVIVGSITGLVFDTSGGSLGTPSQKALRKLSVNSYQILLSADFPVLLSNAKEEINGGNWSLMEALTKPSYGTGSNTGSSILSDDYGTAKQDEKLANPVGESNALATARALGNPVHIAAALGLVFDWLDSRSDCIFDANCLSQLSALLLPRSTQHHEERQQEQQPLQQPQQPLESESPTHDGTHTEAYSINSMSPSAATFLSLHINEIFAKQLCKTRLAILQKLLGLIISLEGHAAGQFYVAVRIALSCLQKTPKAVTNRAINADFLRTCQAYFDDPASLADASAPAYAQDVFVIVQLLLFLGRALLQATAHV